MMSMSKHVRILQQECVLLPVEAPNPEIQVLNDQAEMLQEQLTNFENTPSLASLQSHSPGTAGKMSTTSGPVSLPVNSGSPLPGDTSDPAINSTKAPDASTRLTKQDSGNPRSTLFSVFEKGKISDHRHGKTCKNDKEVVTWLDSVSLSKHNEAKLIT